MARLVLVKHAMPFIDTSMDARDWQLADDGRAKSSQLADRLAPYGPDVILSSTEPKAIQTAGIVANKLNLPHDAIAGLHEHDRRGVPWMDKQQFHSAVQAFFDNPSTVIFGGESADQAFARFRDALNLALDRHQARNVVAVTHGTVISLYVSRTVGMDPFDLWAKLGLPSYVVLSWPDVELLEVVDRLG